ncbi:MAG: hypothetical protein HZA50_04440 [Planctomycetes bacterium]|nr:hypothetical protein [Planctomycetota bacterium]
MITMTDKSSAVPEGRDLKSVDSEISDPESGCSRFGKFDSAIASLGPAGGIARDILTGRKIRG